jgi:hypothetical protein
MKYLLGVKTTFSYIINLINWLHKNKKIKK